MIPTAESHVVNYEWLKELMLSKDLSRLDELKALGENPKFLDGKKIEGNLICFDSFPRTGNTFLRTFIEQCSGIHTGADMPLWMTTF